MSSRFPPLAPQPAATRRPSPAERTMQAVPLPLMELGILCLFGLLLLSS